MQLLAAAAVARGSCWGRWQQWQQGQHRCGGWQWQLGMTALATTRVLQQCSGSLQVGNAIRVAQTNMFTLYRVALWGLANTGTPAGTQPEASLSAFAGGLSRRIVV